MRKFRYNKPSEARRELSPVREPEKEATISSSTERQQGLISQPLGYEPIATEEQEPDLFIVISGGEKRECNYLDRLKTKGYRSLSIEFVAPQGKKSGSNKSTHSGSSPKDILAYWQRNYQEDTHDLVIKDYAYQMTEIDHIFFLTDLDSFRSELQSILADQKETPYQWIISNPCFEIWLYYSYFSDDPSEKLKKLLFLSEEKRSNKLKTLNNKLLPGGIDPRKAFDEMETAIKNACTYWPGADKYNIPKLFGTQIYFLAEQIWSRIEKEFKKNRADSFKRGLLIP